jgi:hypothetical protein
MRQLLTESLVLTRVATVLGLALAFAGVRFVAWWNPRAFRRVAGVRLDLTVLVFTAIVAVITSIVFQPSLPPCGRCESILTESSKDGAQGASSGGRASGFAAGWWCSRWHSRSCLLVGAGLMLRSLWSLQHVPLGLDPHAC